MSVPAAAHAKLLHSVPQYGRAHCTASVSCEGHKPMVALLHELVLGAAGHPTRGQDDAMHYSHEIKHLQWGFHAQPLRALCQVSN